MFNCIQDHAVKWMALTAIMVIIAVCLAIWAICDSSQVNMFVAGVGFCSCIIIAVCNYVEANHRKGN